MPFPSLSLLTVQAHLRPPPSGNPHPSLPGILKLRTANISRCRLCSCVYSRVLHFSPWTTGLGKQVLLSLCLVSPGIQGWAQSSSWLGILLFSSQKAREASGRQSSRCSGLPAARGETDISFLLQGVPGMPGTKGGPGDKVR